MSWFLALRLAREQHSSLHLEVLASFARLEIVGPRIEVYQMLQACVRWRPGLKPMQLMGLSLESRLGEIDSIARIYESQFQEATNSIDLPKDGLRSKLVLKRIVDAAFRSFIKLSTTKKAGVGLGFHGFLSSHEAFQSVLDGQSLHSRIPHWEW